MKLYLRIFDISVFLSILLCFNFSNNDFEIQLYTKFIPIILFFLFSFLLIVKFYKLLRLKSTKIFLSPLFISYLIFIVVNLFSGNLKGVNETGWLLWKNIEIFAGLVWFLALNYVINYNPEMIFKRLLYIIYLCLIILTLFVIYNQLNMYSLTEILFTSRVESEFPKINPITLSIIGVFIFFTTIYLKPFNNIINYLIISFALFLILAAKSRTGVLIIVNFYLINLLIANRGRFNLFFVFLVFLVFDLNFTNFFSSNLLEILRLDSEAEIWRFGGRIRGYQSERFIESSWGESIAMISENIFFGVGNINTHFQLATKLYSVDNFVLQNLIAAGVVGGSLLSTWAFIIFPLQFLTFYTRKIKKINIPFLSLIFSFLLIFWIKSFTTNGASYYGLEFLLLVIVYLYFIKYEHS